MALRTPHLLLFIAILFGCSDENLEKDKVDTAVARASIYCGSSSAQLSWLRLIIEESEKDGTLKGNIYTFQSNGKTVFMHQPWIMSCLGCIMYDCQGNRLKPEDIDQEKLANGFQDLILIYEAFM